MHEGHRQRMLDKVRSNPAGLADHEILEVLLFAVIPRKNTNPIAHDLMRAFGGLKGVLHATYEQLLTVDGVGETTAAYLCCIGELIARAEEDMPKASPLRSPLDFRKYLSDRFASEESEFLEFYCLDAMGNVTFVKRYTTEDERRVTVQPEEISRCIISKLPSSVLVAHNHPRGSAKPSAEDRAFTRMLTLLCVVNNVRFYDHMIVGADGEIYSFRLAGDLEDMISECNALLGKEVRL